MIWYLSAGIKKPSFFYTTASINTFVNDNPFGFSIVLFANNAKFALLAEQALRGVKTKMKVAGQFSSSRSANYYAKIRSYIETCRRNGINEITALLRLCKGNPFTVEEIFSTG